MRKYAFLVIATLFIAGCSLQTVGNIYADPTRISVNLTAISNNATATAVSATQAAELLANPQQSVQPTATTGAPAGDQAAAVTLSITNVIDNGAGSVTVQWSGTGDFSSGFKVLYDLYDDSPELATSPWVYLPNHDARSATLSLQAGKRYFLRVCRYWNGACDPYSLPVEITLAAAAPTATTAPTTSLSIIDIDDVSTGKAIIYWDAVGSFPEGFKIVWSSTNSSPTYPGDTWLYISDPAARNTYVTGDPGQKYYFRVCKYQDGVCKSYSETRSFTFAGSTVPVTKSITITNIKEISSGTAKIYWTPVGYFASGFKIAYSETNPLPVYPGDAYVYVSDPAAVYAAVNGTPGHTYYYRVCEYTGGACGVYSNVYTFTFSGAVPTADTATITNLCAENTTLGNGTLCWDATGDFSSGFKVLYSTTNSSPTYGSADLFWVDGAARSTPISGTPGTTYYYRVCKYTGSGCSVYSNVVTFTYASAPEPTPDTSTISITSISKIDDTSALVTWDAVGTFDGFKLTWNTSGMPSYPADGGVWYDGAATSGNLTGLALGSTYYVRVCKYTASGCTIYSSQAQYLAQ